MRHCICSPPSGGEDDPEVDTDREDFETLASLQSSITMARALFHKRCKKFKDATVSSPPATAEDGLEHFGLFVAQRLRMVDATVQARLMSSILNLVVPVPCGLSE
ncbi:hypothetical protein MRX96_052790 [Rhipicephalus microplus]